MSGHGHGGSGHGGSGHGGSGQGGDAPAAGDTPTAYSTELNGQGSAADGYNIVIAPGQLDSAINTYAKTLHGDNPGEVGNQLKNSVMGQTQFGQIPQATTIDQKLTTFISGHAAAMAQMDGVLNDFVATVQAAADMGRTGDEETQAVAALVAALRIF